MRQAAQLKGGFYPAPPEAVAMAAEYLQRPEKGRFALLDPCAGEGDALCRLAVALDADPADVHGVELEVGRAEKLKARLPESPMVGPASFFGCTISPGSFSLVWCNPPFDNEIGGGSRVEGLFLERATHLLVPGGILALVCPESVADRSDIRQMLMCRFDLFTTVPFPAGHRRYNEVIVFGIKRKEVVHPWGVRWSSCLRTTTGPYVLPASRGPRTFAKTEMTDDELIAALDASPLRRHLEPPAELPLPRPPLSLSKGHRAMLLAAGQLDGVVCPADEPPHVVRGTAVKSSYVNDVEESENNDGSITTKTTICERILLYVRAVWPDGTIRDFKQE